MATNFSRIIFRIFLCHLFLLSIHGAANPFPIVIKCSLGEAIFLNNICVSCFLPVEEGLSNDKAANDGFRNVRNHGEWISCAANADSLDKANVIRGAKFLSGRQVRVVTIERRPFVKVLKGNYSGVCFELFYTLQDKYNFSRAISLPYDGNWGTRLANGSWDGMVGLVQRNDVDMGVAGFSVTLERSSVVAFTESFHQEPTAILIPPPTAGEKVTVLIRPLSFQVWVAIGVTMLTFAPSIYAMHIISLRIRGELIPSRYFSLLDISLELIHFMISSLVQQSVICPGSKTNRFLVILWWMMTLIVSSIYVAYLVSYLSAPRLFNKVNTLDDLVAQHKIKWTFRKSSALDSLFKSSSSMGVFKAVGDGVTDSDLVKTDYEGALKALTGKYAFIKEKSFLDVALEEDFQKTHTCQVTLAKQTFFKVETALIAGKRSIELLAVFNDGIRWAVSTGLMEKWKKLHWPKDLWCEDAAAYISRTQPKTKKLDFEDVSGASFLWMGGLSISVLAFLTELCGHGLGAFLHKKRYVETASTK